LLVGCGATIDRGGNGGPIDLPIALNGRHLQSRRLNAINKNAAIFLRAPTPVLAKSKQNCFHSAKNLTFWRLWQTAAPARGAAGYAELLA
jgi:hypothetical protein